MEPNILAGRDLVQHRLIKRLPLGERSSRADLLLEDALEQAFELGVLIFPAETDADGRIQWLEAAGLLRVKPPLELIADFAPITRLDANPAFRSMTSCAGAAELIPNQQNRPVFEQFGWQVARVLDGSELTHFAWQVLTPLGPLHKTRLLVKMPSSQSIDLL